MPNFFSASQGWDPIEFEKIVKTRWERILHILCRVCESPDDAEDLALEVFWRLWENPPPNFENLDGWLYRVATNLAYNQLRSQARRRRYEQQAGKINLVESAVVLPEKESERLQEARKVRQVLEKMKPAQARLLILRYSGLSYREISMALNLNPNSIGKLLARAQKSFCKKYLDGEDHAFER